MASQPSRLRLIVTPAARRDQLDIWDYNAQVSGADHADAYLAFLNRETEKLVKAYESRRSVSGREHLQFITIRKGRGHGHVVIYRLVEDAIEILRYFHTAQEGRNQIG